MNLWTRGSVVVIDPLVIYTDCWSEMNRGEQIEPGFGYLGSNRLLCMQLNQIPSTFKIKALITFSALVAFLAVVPDTYSHPAAAQVIIEAIHQVPTTQTRIYQLEVCAEIPDKWTRIETAFFPKTQLPEDPFSENVQFLLTFRYLPLLARSFLS